MIIRNVNLLSLSAVLMFTTMINKSIAEAFKCSLNNVVSSSPTKSEKKDNANQSIDFFLSFEKNRPGKMSYCLNNSCHNISDLIVISDIRSKDYPKREVKLISDDGSELINISSGFSEDDYIISTSYISTGSILSRFGKCIVIIP